MTLLIEEPQALSDFCARIRGSAWIAVDTEFTRERTYYARLGLLQLATDDIIACIDPLKVDLSPLLDVLYDPSMLKVLHAARQDLEVLYDQRKAVPQPLFDTQIAAALLGHPEQVGYAPLVETITGVKLPKLHTRTDWEARPLSSEQLHYAEDDVRYLRDVYRALDAELQRLDRLSWLAEECAALTDVMLYRNDPELAYQRLKGGGALDIEAQPRLQALAAWRERTAQTLDRPRGWIVPDNALMEIARLAPESSAVLARAPEMTPGRVDSFGTDILTALATTRSTKPERLWIDSRPPTPAEQTLARKLLARVGEIAQAHNIQPGIIATRRAIFALIRERSGPLTHGWRQQLVGNELLALNNG
ncbi:MAG: ribonuclease D [Gammaproteobacteria bacterium]|nr:ribonuclease D [Gammaproteobacteria bacterium]